MAHSQMAGYHAVGHSTAAGLLEEQTPRQGWVTVLTDRDALEGQKMPVTEEKFESAGTNFLKFPLSLYHLNTMF